MSEDHACMFTERDLNKLLTRVSRMFVESDDPAPDPNFTLEKAGQVSKALGVLFPDMIGQEVPVKALARLYSAIRGWGWTTLGRDLEAKSEKSDEPTVTVK